MSDLNQRPHPDTLEQATTALRDSAVPPGPSADLVAATVAAIASRGSVTTPAATPAQLRRRRMIRFISYGTATAAAVGLVVVAGVLGTAGRAPAAELTEALDNTEKAKSFKHVTKMTMDGKTMFEMTMYKQGERWRFEAGKEIAIVVDEQQNVIQFNHEDKTATRLDVKSMGGKERGGGEAKELAKKIRELKGEGVERLGEETLDGRKVTAYLLKDVETAEVKADWKVWVNPKQKLPVRMEMTKGNDGAAIVITSEYSDWDAEFDAKLFSTDIPVGYKLVEVEKK